MTKLKDLLIEKRAAVLGKWFDAIIETYPPDTSNFLKKQKDRFANPVGAAIAQGIEGIYEELLHENGKDKVSSFLDNIIRIRAIQDFTPAQAISFIFLLKKVIREEIGEEMNENLAAELLEVESGIDSLALSAFDIFMKCREKIYDIKANELRSMTFRLLQRADLISEIKEEKQDA